MCSETVFLGATLKVEYLSKPHLRSALALRLSFLALLLSGSMCAAYLFLIEPDHSFGEKLVLLALVGLPTGYALYRLIAGALRGLRTITRYMEQQPHSSGLLYVIAKQGGEVGRLATAIAKTQDAMREKITEAHQIYKIDPVTSAFSRPFLLTCIRDSIQASEAYSGHTALLFLDIDQFSQVDDVYGSDVADRALRHVCTCIRDVLLAHQFNLIEHDRINPLHPLYRHLGKSSKDALIGRVGSDEFVVLLPRIKDAQQPYALAEAISEALTHQVQINRLNFSPRASIGIALSHSIKDRARNLLRNSELAMRHGRQTTDDHIGVYDSHLHDMIIERHYMERDLREALRTRRGLQLYYQPQIRTDGSIHGVEALIRWKRNTVMVPPGDFLPLAEQTDLIEHIGRFVLEEACAQLQTWLAEGRHITMAVNISLKQLEDAAFLSFVSACLAKHDIPAGALEIELTETIVGSQSDMIQRNIADLSAMGVRISIDDFGTGFSNMARLFEYQFTALKIDRSFVMKVEEDETSRVLVRSLIDLAQALGVETVAEGIETIEQRDFLIRNGCTHLQGFLFSRPLPAREAATWMDLYGASDVHHQIIHLDQHMRA